jgi:hypothetical protein
MWFVVTTFFIDMLWHDDDHVDEGETTSLNSGRQQACFSSPKRYIRMMLTKEILINPPKLCSNPTSRVI